jgi:DNA polymerase-4
MANRSDAHWPRAIALVDMNAFFAAIEQRDDPQLRGQPVAVTNGLTGTCIITSSYEARAYGVKTGMRLKEALRLCPGLVRRPARPERYAKISTAIMVALQDITPDVEVFSVDEAFLDVTACQSLWGSPREIGSLIKHRVFESSGLRSSIGISGDKSTAKFAAKLQKPDGLTVIPPWESRARLENVPVIELCGVKAGIGGFLAEHGARTCGEVARLPISVLARRFGNPGRRIWHMCQGTDPEPVRTTVKPPLTLGHGKVVPPDTRDRQLLMVYLMHMAEKVAARLRQNQLEAQQYFVGLRTIKGWVGDRFSLIAPTYDNRPLFGLCHRVLDDYWHREGVFQVQVTALDPRPAGSHSDMFEHRDERRGRLNQAMDAINLRYGEFTLSPAPLLARSDMPNVIAPAWKPYGHRQTICKEIASRTLRQ